MDRQARLVIATWGDSLAALKKTGNASGRKTNRNSSELNNMMADWSLFLVFFVHYRGIVHHWICQVPGKACIELKGLRHHGVKRE